jgi:hypothetical protein
MIIRFTATKCDGQCNLVRCHVHDYKEVHQQLSQWNANLHSHTEAHYQRDPGPWVVQHRHEFTHNAITRGRRDRSLPDGHDYCELST